MTDSYIEKGSGGTMFAGEAAVRLYSLTSIKFAVKLEAKGMRVSRGPKVTPRWLKHYGLKRGDTDGLIAKLDDEIAKLRSTVHVYNTED